MPRESHRNSHSGGRRAGENPESSTTPHSTSRKRHKDTSRQFVEVGLVRGGVGENSLGTEIQSFLFQLLPMGCLGRLETDSQISRKGLVKMPLELISEIICYLKQLQ